MDGEYFHDICPCGIASNSQSVLAGIRFFQSIAFSPILIKVALSRVPCGNITFSLIYASYTYSHDLNQRRPRIPVTGSESKTCQFASSLKSLCHVSLKSDASTQPTQPDF